MTTSPGQSLPPSFFDEIYAEADDPWSFTTSDYEREKYATTLAELPRERLGEQCFPEPGRSRQQRGSASVFERVAELEERSLLGLAGIIEPRIGRVVERSGREMPMRFVH